MIALARAQDTCARPPGRSPLLRQRLLTPVVGGTSFVREAASEQREVADVEIEVVLVAQP
jgi:hypothetical protein